MKTIDISSKKLKSLPKDLPEVVNGSFVCYNNKLTSLQGAPKIVEYWFCCYQNNLTNLKSAPMIVRRGFLFWKNRLISLDFLPLKYTIVDHMSFPSIKVYDSE